MNKRDLVRAVAKRTELTRKEAAGALEAVLEEIRGALRRGERVSLVGFGGFEVRQRQVRISLMSATRFGHGGRVAQP